MKSRTKKYVEIAVILLVAQILVLLFYIIPTGETSYSVVDWIIVTLLIISSALGSMYLKEKKSEKKKTGRKPTDSNK